MSGRREGYDQLALLPSQVQSWAMLVRGIDMTRLIVLAIATLVGGCASAPNSGNGNSVTTQPAPKAQAVSDVVRSDPSTLPALQKAGYTIKNQDGKVLYCRTDTATGSHLRRQTSCLTEEEWQQLAEQSRRGIQGVSQAVPPPAGK